MDVLVTKSLKSLGIALFETGIVWFWIDNKIKNYLKSKGCLTIKK
ncbi:hypothetical protein MMK73_002290 [Providencia rettgeri]